MREKYVEKKLVEAVRKRGGICPKWVSPGMSGVPDRIVLLPDGNVGFVELKATGKKARPLQLSVLALISHLGFQVFVLDDPSRIEEVLDAIQTP